MAREGVIYAAMKSLRHDDARRHTIIQPFLLSLRHAACSIFAYPLVDGADDVMSAGHED